MMAGDQVDEALGQWNIGKILLAKSPADIPRRLDPDLGVDEGGITCLTILDPPSLLNSPTVSR
jgi:hypothetical protein